MKVTVFRKPTISDCDLCCWYGTKEEHDCEHCIIVSGFDTNKSYACGLELPEEEE